MDGVFLEIPFALLIPPLDERSSLTDLEKNAVDHVPTTKRQYATDEVRITGLKLSPYVQSNGLLFRANAFSSGRKYSPLVMFNNVQFEDADTDNNITFKASDNKDYHIQQIDAKNQPCQVRCNCMDFYYRFSIWNYNDDSLYGEKPPTYIKTTDRESDNPDRVPGLCKHLMALGQMLHNTQLIG